MTAGIVWTLPLHRDIKIHDVFAVIRKLRLNNGHIGAGTLGSGCSIHKVKSSDGRCGVGIVRQFQEQLHSRALLAECSRLHRVVVCNSAQMCLISEMMHQLERCHGMGIEWATNTAQRKQIPVLSTN